MINYEPVWRSLHNSCLGDACFIIGNGKSLADEDNQYLSSFPSFGTNRIYLKFKPTYYVTINPLVAEQYHSEIESLDTLKFVTDRVPMYGVIPLHSNPVMAFSREPNKWISEGYTVTYVALQLAYYMGFHDVYLIGVDHNYIYSGEPNQQLTAQGADPNHFDPTYFSEGKQWNAPDLLNSERAYKIAKRVYEGDRRKIWNLTPNSKLDVFDYKEEV